MRPTGPPTPLTRRAAAMALAIGVAWGLPPGSARAADPSARRWMDAAEAMRQRALGWGDQDYGAVVVLDGVLVGEGPSRVVKDQDADAHAERVALRDAQRRLGRADLAGAVLYSTSRPCARCETAAARAGVARMVYGASLHDGGRPHDRHPGRRAGERA